MPCTHSCDLRQSTSTALRASPGLRLRSMKPLGLLGSRRAVPPSFVLHAVAENGQQPRGQQNGRARPPLQRQRPGPQRPMDAKQRQQRPQRQMPPFKQEPDAQPQTQQSSGSAGQAQQPRGLQRGPPQQQDRVTPVGAPPKQRTAVHFCLQFDTQYGQRIRLVGSHPNLGEEFGLWKSPTGTSVCVGPAFNTLASWHPSALCLIPSYVCDSVSLGQTLHQFALMASSEASAIWHAGTDMQFPA